MFNRLLITDRGEYSRECAGEKEKVYMEGTLRRYLRGKRHQRGAVSGPVHKTNCPSVEFRSATKVLFARLSTDIFFSVSGSAKSLLRSSKGGPPTVGTAYYLRSERAELVRTVKWPNPLEIQNTFVSFVRSILRVRLPYFETYSKFRTKVHA